MVLKELLEIAKSQLDELTTLKNPDFRLEQAEFKKSEGIWDIVVSFLVENTNKRTTAIAALTSEFQFHRIYKRLKINNTTKEILGFYIYNSTE